DRRLRRGAAGGQGGAGRAPPPPRRPPARPPPRATAPPQSRPPAPPPPRRAPCGRGRDRRARAPRLPLRPAPPPRRPRAEPRAWRAQVTEQAMIQSGGHAYDALTTVDQAGHKTTYYFLIDRVLAAESAALKPGAVSEGGPPGRSP